MSLSTPVKELFNLPSQLAGLDVPLDSLWEKILVEDILPSVILPPEPAPTHDLLPALTTDQALAELADLSKSVILPDVPDITLETIVPNPVIPTQGVLNITLKALSDLELEIFSDFTAVFNAGGFNAKITYSDKHIAVETKLTLSGRFGGNLLKPMKKVTVGGDVRYEPDTSKSYVEFNLAEVSISYDTTNGLKYDFASGLAATQPFSVGGSDLVFDPSEINLDLSGPEKCLAVQFPKSQIKSWLSKISPTLADESPAPATTGTDDDQITGRIIFGDGADPIQEIRIDWVMAENRTMSLPGVKVQTPENTLFTLSLRQTNGSLTDLALVVTFTNVKADLDAEMPKLDANNPPPTPKKVLWAYSTFAWGRDDEREMHNDEQKTEVPKLFDLRLGTNATDATPKTVSLMLVDVDVSGSKSPTFLQQLAKTLTKPRLDDPALCTPTDFTPISLNGDDWKAQFRLDKDAFKFPFLSQDKPADGSPASQNAFEQFVEIDPPGANQIEVDFGKKQIDFTIGVTLKFGSIQFNSDIDVGFSWERFALLVDHNVGLNMLSDKAELESQEHLGLVWRMKGAKEIKNNVTKYHYFTLVTKDYNYQVQMAKDASFELDYVKASKEPITFIVSDFALGAKGLDLSAEVSDRPARLNGINTRFTFNGSRLTVKENHIQDFTLSGSGPLPPDLVGDAMADVSMQFAQQEGKLTLIRCKANLQGSKLLDCKNTRFQFSVDAIGMEFVNDGAFHLYFTLTGSAQFVLGTGDDKEGALALLPKIKIDLVQCPLCGDASVIAKHIDFLIEFPKPKSFNFLGAFEMELRAIGFYPSVDFFDDQPAAMLISGQLKFAQGPGDTPDPHADYHKLYIALPKPGDFFPRLHFTQIAVNLAIGEAFKLQGVVEFKDSDTEKGFLGEGSIELQGLPSIAAAFGFLRVRRDTQSAWVRAWFLYLEVRRLSIMIPYIEIYLREVGLGFGYRFTIASIKVADRENDIKKLISSLQELSHTQADLSRRDRWEVDLEDAGEDPRWTIVLRALFSQTSASTMIRYNATEEEELPNIILFDVMIAFRSDLTFYMAARGWINTNYFTYDKNENGEVKENPFVSGFIILVPRRKMFLAHAASNKDAFIGDNPPLPDLVKKALKAARFSTTLLIEPGLLHFELGWPNNIGWDFEFGPLKVSITSGFIFRLTRDNLVMGISYKASGTIDLKAELDLGLVGVRVSVFAHAAWGARLMGKLPLPPHGDPLNVRIYGLVGLEMQIEISIELFIRIPLVFTTIEIDFKLSLGIGFTAGMEISMAAKVSDWGIRGSGTLYIMAMGHRLEVSASLSFNGDAVESAKQLTGDILNMGLEATEVEGVPGVPDSAGSEKALSAGAPRAMAARASIKAPSAAKASPASAAQALGMGVALKAFALGDAPPIQSFELPDYSVFVIRGTKQDDWSYFVLLPKGEHKQADGTYGPEPGFLPPPPLNVNMQSEDWVSSLNNHTTPPNLILAIKDVFKGTNWENPNLFEVQVIQSGGDWMLSAGSNLIRITRNVNNLTLRPYTASGSTDFPPVQFFEFAALDALQSHNVEELKIAFGATLPDPVDRIVTIYDNQLWQVYAGEKIYELTRKTVGGWIFWFTTVGFDARILQPSGTAGRDLALDDFADSLTLTPSALPRTVIDALTESGIKAAQPISVTSDGSIYTFKIGVDTYHLEKKDGSNWTLSVDRGNDFRFVMPPVTTTGEVQQDFEIDQYRWDGSKGDWFALEPGADGNRVSTWQVHWSAQLFNGKSKSYDVTADKKLVNGQGTTITLRDYLTYAYELAPIKAQKHPAIPPQTVPVSDPDAGDIPRPLADDRVHNPTDNSYEAAVRGALEQFAGSPYFKHDPDNILYDRMLQEAFQSNTTIYTADGTVPTADDQLQQMHETQQSRQLRGMVVQDIVGSLQQYVQQVSATPSPNSEPNLDDKIPFQMGLVFRYKNGKPFWLDNFIVEGTKRPTIQQRQTPSSNDASTSPAKGVDTFNILTTAFNTNPPRFQRVQQYTSSVTIAIAWDLEWSQPPDEDCTPAQKDPQHHLAYYAVRRRALDGGERDLVYQVKPSHAAHRRDGSDGDPGGTLLLQSRFQVVDHFTDETAEDRSSLPESGRSYLYTITPMDLAGNAGRPLTLIATRFPDEVPPVPLQSELTATYQLNPNDLIPEAADVLSDPPAFPPHRIHIEWDDNLQTQTNGHVAVRDYRLIFRKDPTVPVGSYGLDSTTQQPASRLLPTSNARPLASDIKIKIPPDTIDSDPVTGRRSADLLPQLQAAGVVASVDNPDWQPESWRVFFQTISANGVPSSLVPVELRLRAESVPVLGVAAGVEERAPAEMEWLARPIRFPILPPEDQRAIPGIAHFPMPIKQSGKYAFQPDLANITFREHPAKIRCVRFRWNQGPSNIPGYPLDLNAGYNLLLLDIDAQPDDVFDDTDELENALRQIQEIQMLPAADMLLQPAETRRTSQWEAWYPSTIQRLRTDEAMAKLHSQNRYGPWYSWRESRLVWPYCPLSYIDTAEPFVRKADLHPFLAHLIDLLKAPRQAGDTAAYLVTTQPPPPIQPNDWAAFKDNTAPKNDPYGWAVLQRLGLSVTFSLRDDRTGDLLTGDALLNEVQKKLAALASEAANSIDSLDPNKKPIPNDGKNMADVYYRHLFVELLFQPGKSVSLDETAANPTELLALVQVSLRPVAEQYLSYHKITIAGPTGGEIETELLLTAKQQIDLVNDGDPSSGVVSLTASDDAKPIKNVYQLPVGGVMQLAFRGPVLDGGPQAVNIRVKLAGAPHLGTVIVPGAPWLLYVKENSPEAHYIKVNSTKTAFTTAQEQQIRAALSALDPNVDNTPAINTILSLQVSTLDVLAPTDELTTRFSAPSDTLVTNFATTSDASGIQWNLFRRYVMALNDPDAANQIILSTSVTEIGTMLSGFLDWSQRFFDMGADVTVDKGVGSVVLQGTAAAPLPWVATAYPRAGSPAYASPDTNGRLQYDHLFEDRWAHNYRFYIRPYGRYDLIWRSFSQSRALFPDGLSQDVRKSREPVQPDPKSGALDVVIERTQPIEPPLILSSTRLDKPTIPGQPVPPGKTWEVIIAQHPEQALVERNQTLARQLSFRQIAFTLLRRFTDANWVAEFSRLVQPDSKLRPYVIQTRMVSQAEAPDMPQTYPALPDHLLLNSPDTLTEDDARSLAIPARVSTFQQGALVLQWRALPFYYTHRLLVIAQTTSMVSPVNQTEQSNFEYVTPTPAGDLSGLKANWTFTANNQSVTQQMPIRRIAIPLRPFWDSLPSESQAAWSDEQPDAPGSAETTRKFSSLPDPSVVYQLVELFSGNIEVQVEFFYDSALATPRYSERQLGKHFFGKVMSIAAPPDVPTSPANGQSIHDDFLLLTGVAQVIEEQLSTTIQVPSALAGKVTVSGKKLTIQGILTFKEKEQLKAIVATADKPTIEALYNDWYSEEPVSEDRTSSLPADLLSDPPNQIDRATFMRGDDAKLVWTGTMSDEEKAALLALPGDVDFNAGLQTLADAVAKQPADNAAQAVTIIGVSNDPEPIPPELTTASKPIPQTDRLTLQQSNDKLTYINLTWKGFLLDDELPTFDTVSANWAQLDPLKTALADVRNQLEQRTLVEPLPAPPFPLVQADLPPSLQHQLILPTAQKPNLTWMSPAPTDALRADLEAVKGYDGFEQAVKLLLEQWDNGNSTPAPAASIPTVFLPTYEPIHARMSLDAEKHVLTWPEPLITDKERAFLTSWIQFLHAFETFRGQMQHVTDKPTIIPIPNGVIMPPLDEMQNALPNLFKRNLFDYNLQRRELGWPFNSPPNGAEIQDILALTGGGFSGILQALLTAIDRTRVIDLTVPLFVRPTQADLDPSLQTNLTIAPTSLTWKGRVTSQAEYDALSKLAANKQFDKDFVTAAAVILRTLTDSPLTSPVDPPIPVRPRQKDLPALLATKFLIGNWRLRFYGLMVVDEGKELLNVFKDSPADQQAIQRLYASSLQHGMRGRKLMIRARRGSAKPSDLIELHAEPLTADQGGAK